MDSHTSSHGPAKFRILMFHGFAQNGQNFRVKASRITDRVTELLTPEILPDFPGGIEYLYPDAPIALEHPIGLGKNKDDESDDNAKDFQNPMAQEPESLLGWWYGRDIVSRYTGMEKSLSSVANHIRGRPVHGAVAYSQGATLAGIICSLLDCSDNPAKIEAIRAQGLPVDDYLSLPGQEQLRFFVGMSGYKATLEYYGSVYQWPIRTPSCHTFASLDAVVPHWGTVEFGECFTSYDFVHFEGTHFSTPRDRVTVQAVAEFILEHSCPRPTPSSMPASVSTSCHPLATNSANDRTSNSHADRKLTTITFWKRKRKTCVARSQRTQIVAPRRLISPLLQQYYAPIR